MSRQVRVRKLNKSTSQQVYREDEIDSAEYKALLNQHAVSLETGVEKRHVIYPFSVPIIFHEELHNGQA